MNLLLSVIGALWLVLSAGAVQAKEPCPVPEDLALRNIALPAARRAVADKSALTILVLGGTPMAGAMTGDPTTTLPAQLQVELTDALPGVRVRVVNGAVPRSSAEATVARMPDRLREIEARVVIWATGSREVAMSADLDPFFATLRTGIRTVRDAGADLILVDMQYAPSIARIMNNAPFRAVLLGIAAASDIPILPRYELMMRWNDDGLLNLDALDPQERQLVARRLFACLAVALSRPIAAAVR